MPGTGAKTWASQAFGLQENHMSFLRDLEYLVTPSVAAFFRFAGDGRQHSGELVVVLIAFSDQALLVDIEPVENVDPLPMDRRIFVSNFLVFAWIERLDRLGSMDSSKVDPHFARRRRTLADIVNPELHFLSIK